MPRPPSSSSAIAAALALALAGLTACASSQPRAQPSQPASPPSAPQPPAPGARRRAFVLHFEGARIGYAIEDEQVAPELGRRELGRRELVRFRRGRELTSFETSVIVRGATHDGRERPGEADELEVVVRHCTAESPSHLPALSLTAPLGLACPDGARPGPFTVRASARRTDDEWRVTSSLSDAPTTLPFAAQPAEWLDVLAPPGDRGELRNLPLFFATRGFALGHAERRWLDARTWIGSVTLAGKVITSTTVLDEEGRPRLILDDNGGTASRAPEAALSPATLDLVDLVDLVDLTSLAIGGAAPAPGAPRRLAFTLPPEASASSSAATLPPREAPGQLVTGAPPRLVLELVAQPARLDDAPAVARIAELARQVLPGHRGGDCTAYALRYAAAAARAAIPTRLVTGFALDETGAGGAVLVRHRWAVSWTGARWISVDPSAPAEEVAPAAPRLFALSIHEATPEALAAAESAFAAWRGAAARWAR